MRLGREKQRKKNEWKNATHNVLMQMFLLDFIFIVFFPVSFTSLILLDNIRRFNI